MSSLTYRVLITTWRRGNGERLDEVAPHVLANAGTSGSSERGEISQACPEGRLYVEVDGPRALLVLRHKPGSTASRSHSSRYRPTLWEPDTMGLAAEASSSILASQDSAASRVDIVVLTVFVPPRNGRLSSPRRSLPRLTGWRGGGAEARPAVMSAASGARGMGYHLSRSDAYAP